MLDVLTRRIRRGTIRARIKAAYSTEPRVTWRSRWHVSPRGKVTKVSDFAARVDAYNAKPTTYTIRIGQGFIGDEKALAGC